MKFQFRIDLRHWMVGISFDTYNTLISIGPINIMAANYKKYYKHMEREMAQQFYNTEGK